MKIGIYSGTFDPIHEGHVLFAQVAIEQYGLDRILFIPEAKPRSKKHATDVDTRRAMISLATGDSENMQVYDGDDEDSHTVSGLISSIARDFPDDEYFILLGSDVFEHIGKWGSREDEEGSIEDVKDAVAFIVGISSMEELPKVKEVEDSTGLTSRLIEVPLGKISSSDIRESIMEGKEARGLNDDVARFIKQAKLYQKR